MGWMSCNGRVVRYGWVWFGRAGARAGQGRVGYGLHLHLHLYPSKHAYMGPIWATHMGSATGFGMGPIWVSPYASCPDGSHIGPIYQSHKEKRNDIIIFI